MIYRQQQMALMLQKRALLTQKCTLKTQNRATLAYHLIACK